MPEPAPPPPAALVALLRGLLKRCPRCGRGELFSRWFRLPERCPRCGLRFEREEGAFLGSLALNYGGTGLAFVLLLGVWLALTLPDPPVVPIVVTSILVTPFLPLLLYPFAKTTWAAVDLLLHGPGSEPDGEGGSGTVKVKWSGVGGLR